MYNFFVRLYIKKVQAAVTLPQSLLPVSTAPPPVIGSTTYPATAYLPPSTPQPTTAASVQLLPEVIIVEPIRPVTIPAFIAPATTAPITLPPVTQPSILSFPPRPTVGPIVVDPPAIYEYGSHASIANGSNGSNRFVERRLR